MANINMQGICPATPGVVAPRSKVPPAQRSFEGNPCSDAGRNVRETFYRVKAGEKSANYGPGGRMSYLSGYVGYV